MSNMGQGSEVVMGEEVGSRDRCIVRDLARRVAEIAALPEQAEKVRLWTACNDLRPERPMVYADPQNGWAELDAAWLRLECEHPAARGFEHALRRRIVRHEHIPDDFPITDTFWVGIHVSGAGYEDYGLSLGMTRSTRQGGAYHIEPAIRTEEDLARLRFRPIRIDHAATDRTLALAQELFGDILRVRKNGKGHWRYGLTRVLIHMRGLDQMMLDMYDNPGLLHRLMGFLRDDFENEIAIYEREGAVGISNTRESVNGSGGLAINSCLPGESHTGAVRTQDGICWGESQETVGVGPRQFEEFVLQYQLPLLARFGLVDYGCCEPLDQKLDVILARVPNLRWVSISPWANRALAAEKLGPRHVYVYKPNPSYICCAVPDWDAAARDLRETLRVARGLPLHLVMKDTNTFCQQPERTTRWARMARQMAMDAA